MSKSRKTPANLGLIEAKIDNLMQAITLEDAMAEPLEELTEAMKPLAKQFEEFKVEGHKASSCLLSWINILKWLA